MNGTPNGEWTNVLGKTFQHVDTAVRIDRAHGEMQQQLEEETRRLAQLKRELLNADEDDTGQKIEALREEILECGKQVEALAAAGNPHAGAAARKAERLQVEAAIALAKRTIARRAPQYHALLLKVTHRFIDDLPPGLIAFTDGRTIYYGPGMIHALGTPRKPKSDEGTSEDGARDRKATLEEQAFAVLHELLHAGLEHPVRLGQAEQRIAGVDMQTAQFCMDVVVNEIITTWLPAPVQVPETAQTWETLQLVMAGLAEVAEVEVPPRYEAPELSGSWLTLHDEVRALWRQAANKHKESTQGNEGRKQETRKKQQEASANAQQHARERQKEHHAESRKNRPEDYADDEKNEPNTNGTVTTEETERDHTTGTEGKTPEESDKARSPKTQHGQQREHQDARDKDTKSAGNQQREDWEGGENATNENEEQSGNGDRSTTTEADDTIRRASDTAGPFGQPENRTETNAARQAKNIIESLLNRNPESDGAEDDDDSEPERTPDKADESKKGDHANSSETNEDKGEQNADATNGRGIEQEKPGDNGPATDGGRTEGTTSPKQSGTDHGTTSDGTMTTAGQDVIPPQRNTTREAEDKEQIRQGAQRIKQCTKTPGTSPGGILGDELADMEVRTNWRRILAGLLQRFLTPKLAETPCKPAKPVITGRVMGYKMVWSPGTTRNRPGGRLGVLVDTSGSIDEKTLKIFGAHVQKIARSFRSPISVFAGDTELTGEWHDVELDMDLWRKIRFTGRGGTLFEPLLTAAEKKDCKIVVYLTDGYATIPPKPKRMGVVWALSPKTTDPAAMPYGYALVIE